MKIPIKYFFILLTFTITGCATTKVTGHDSGIKVTKHDDSGAYHLEATNRVYGSIPNIERLALVAAQDFCKELGKEVLIHDIFSDKISRSTWQSWLTFYCLSGNDPRLDEDTYKKEGIYFKAE